MSVKRCAHPVVAAPAPQLDSEEWGSSESDSDQRPPAAKPAAAAKDLEKLPWDVQDEQAAVEEAAEAQRKEEELHTSLALTQVLESEAAELRRLLEEERQRAEAGAGSEAKRVELQTLVRTCNDKHTHTYVFFARSGLTSADTGYAYGGGAARRARATRRGRARAP